jgi:N-acetylglucosaminyldiphosphoundecaprenol N-acetyl-beta-D-mannosaminyltransferase
LFSAVSARLNLRRAGTRVFFLGGTEAALAEIVRRYGQDFPALKVVGTHSPPFRKEMTAADDRECVERINHAGAELVWVGLGAPKQEKWCSRVRSDVTAGVLAPVGGVFDFYSGRVRLPPRWAQRLGLIWLYRLLQEPRRLARRNLDGPRFLARALSSRGERH